MLRDRIARRWRTRTRFYEPWVGERTGNCPIREHTGDEAYVGRCDFMTYDRICPRHGCLDDYPDNDDRAVAPRNRRFER